MPITERPLTEKQQFWLDHVTAWQESASTATHYADQHNLKSQQLYAWKSYFKNTEIGAEEKSISKIIKTAKPSGHQFIPVELFHDNSCSTIRCKNGQEIVLNYRLSVTELAALIRELTS